MNAISFSDLRASLGAGTLLVDVRRKAAFQAAGETIAGALRRDPDAVADWRKTLPRASDVVVYCLHGHEVSQSVAQALERDGLKARYLEGGIEKWMENEGPLDRKSQGGEHPLGDARAAEDRPDRLPLADLTVRGPGRGVSLCSVQAGARRRHDARSRSV
jgi:thiosulfate sulfurtransferase